MPKSFDGIEVELLWSRFISIMEEAENTLLRLSFSTVIGEARDFACILLDSQLNAIATARMVIPAFTITLPNTVQHFLATYKPDKLLPGDVLITNDPWQGSGHLSDISMAAPIFYGNEIIGYVACCAHVSDIGGTVGYHTGRDVFEEGLAIPVTKIREAGKLNDLLIEIIRVNVRVPDMVTGDLLAMIAALDLASRRVIEVLEDTQMNEILSLSQEANRRAEKLMRSALIKIPTGSYSGKYTFDGYEHPLTIETTINIQNGEAYVDFSGTSPEQMKGAINAPFIISKSAALYAFKYMLTPEVPTCSGIFAPFQFFAPEGCLVNPKRPISVKARTKTTFHISETIFRALANVLPNCVQAASGHSTYIIVNGIDENGQAFNSFYLPGGGMGATAERDGPDCVLFPTNTTITPIEIFESTTPLIILEKALLPDSSGAGRYRGGLGQRIRIISRSKRPVTITLRPEDRICPPLGLLGGKDGRKAKICLNGEIFNGDLLNLFPTDELLVDLPGGGGLGSPHDRDPALVRDEVVKGLLSLKYAVEVHGISENFLSTSANLDKIQ